MRGGSIRWLVFEKEGQIVVESLLYDNLVIYQGILYRVRHKGKEASKLVLWQPQHVQTRGGRPN